MSVVVYCSRHGPWSELTPYDISMYVSTTGVYIILYRTSSTYIYWYYQQQDLCILWSSCVIWCVYRREALVTVTLYCAILLSFLQLQAKTYITLKVIKPTSSRRYHSNVHAHYVNIKAHTVCLVIYRYVTVVINPRDICYMVEDCIHLYFTHAYMHTSI